MPGGLHAMLCHAFLVRRDSLVQTRRKNAPSATGACSTVVIKLKAANNINKTLDAKGVMTTVHCHLSCQSNLRIYGGSGAA